MMPIMRLRRYRVFLIFAVLLTILLYHLSFRNAWDVVVPLVDELRKETAYTHGIDSTINDPLFSTIPRPANNNKPSKTSTSLEAKETLNSPKTIPDIVIPDRKPATAVEDKKTEYEQIRPVSPGRVAGGGIPKEVNDIHWEKQPEHFPVPAESIIHLPSGKPKSIPKIQHEFKAESAQAKAAREKRRDIIREEAKRAWTGYKKHAWMHDELTPVSGKYKDPFCGWAATLVDSLDTLWIMNLTSEFEEAVKSVKFIDFTTSFRNDIPMFETTIRYLGGLLAAYDISGAKYKILLDKAAELGEILYSAFDTPNRMPVLYYQWKPAFASQPHRASSRSGTAELGSMAMEFTRLAQLTKEPRYYDAIARVTDALEEFQNRGTGLGGIFPGDLDASGCNHTKPAPAAPLEEPHGYEPSKTVNQSKEPMGKKSSIDQVTLDLSSGASKTHIKGWDENHAEGNGHDLKVKRLKARKSPTEMDLAKANAAASYAGPVLNIPDATGDKGWDCTPQGLTGASQEYSMGGGQDSTYEYFPKQYVLLGGLEDKYRTMYLKVIDSIREHLLYRPMIPDDDRNLLFSGKLTKSNWGNRPPVLSPELTHLTCFIGGMVGMGAKLFKIEKDLEIAKRLTDTCVWAYETMPSGIMAEGAQLFPCESVKDCTWNETLYFQTLDPSWATRDQQRADYFKNKEVALKAEAEAAQIEADRLALAAKEAADWVAFLKAEGTRYDETPEPVMDSKDIKSRGESALTLGTSKDYKISIEELPRPLQKRQLAVQDGKAPSSKSNDIANEAYENSKIAAGKAPAKKDKSQEPLITQDPMAPLPHREYVKSRIETERIPPGYTRVERKEYILRPEAIESVWYMYRITGDPIWQEKGWKMWEAVVNATKTEYGHSAIGDVTVSGSAIYKKDSMESFWIAETLKYFYLLFSEPELVSLDEWVLNTEAHPFRRPV